MVRLFLFAIMGAAAPILIVGALPSAILLMAAPPAFIYLFAFVALTPMCGVLVWCILPPVRKSQAIGELINIVASAGDQALVARAARRANRVTPISSDWR